MLRKTDAPAESLPHSASDPEWLCWYRLAAQHQTMRIVPTHVFGRRSVVSDRKLGMVAILILTKSKNVHVPPSVRPGRDVGGGSLVYDTYVAPLSNGFATSRKHSPGAERDT